MKKQLMTGFTIAAIALTGFTATPARAGNDDLAKILVGIAAIAIISGALENGNIDITHNPPRNWRHQKWQLPQRCLKTVETRRDGEVRMFKTRCLRRHYYWVNSLPDQCEITVGRRQNRHTGYRPRCLRRHGYHWERQARR